MSRRSNVLAFACVVLAAACKRTPAHIPDLPEAPTTVCEPDSDRRAPDDDPVIETSSRDGWSRDESGYSVWADGTVIFHAGRFKNRGHLPPARVEALLDALDRGGMFSYAPPTCEHALSDGGTGVFTLRHGTKVNSIATTACVDPSPRLTEAWTLIHRVVGSDPCATLAQATLPAYSHEEALKLIDILDDCVEGVDCYAGRALRSFGAQAAPELLDAIRDPDRSHDRRAPLAAVIADARIVSATRALLAQGFYEEAAICGGEQLVPTLIDAYAKSDSLVAEADGPIVRGLKHYPAQTVAQALDKLTHDAREPQMWLYLIGEVSTPAQRDVIAAASKSMPEGLRGNVSEPLACTALRLGGTDPWLRDRCPAKPAP